MTRVLGLDISRNFAVAFLLEDCPKAPFDWFNSFPKITFYRNKRKYKYCSEAVLLTNDAKGLQAFQGLNPDVIVLEPTGYWYSQYWVLAAQKLGCKILWMSHQGLSGHRKHYGFKNKDDDVDAFVLALTYFDEMLPKRRFMEHYRHQEITDLRLAFFERKRLIKDLNRNTNQIKQYLEVEFPEIATRGLTDLGVHGVNPTLGHLAGVSKNRKWPRENTGIGISPRTMYLVMETLEKEARIEEQEIIIRGILDNRIFKPYLEVFVDYGFGLAVSADLLIKCYPLDRFLDAGKIVKDKRGRDKSLRHFQAYLGLGFFYSASGDSSHTNNQVRKSWQGSSLTRADICAWILSNPVKINQFHPKTETQARLKALWIEERKREVTRDGITKTVTLPSFQSLGQDGICRFAFVLTRWLWRDLLDKLNGLEF